MSQEQTNYNCPHCGIDLRTCGIEEKSYLMINFVNGKFRITDTEPTTDYAICRECHQPLDYQTLEQLDLDYTVAPISPVKTRYGNVIKEDYHD